MTPRPWLPDLGPQSPRQSAGVRREEEDRRRLRQWREVVERLEEALDVARTSVPNTSVPPESATPERGFSYLITWIEGPRLVTWLARKLGVRPAFRLPATADVEVALTSVNEAATLTTFRRRGSGPPPPPRPFRETS